MSSSDEYQPESKTRRKRVSKSKGKKVDGKKSDMSFDISLPSCSGYRPPAKQHTTIKSSKTKKHAETESKEAEEISDDLKLPSTPPSIIDDDYDRILSFLDLPPSMEAKNVCDVIRLPPRVGLTSETVEERKARFERYEVVAEENKDRLKSSDFKQYMAINDSPILKGFRKKQKDKEFRRSLAERAAKAKAIKLYSDDESCLISTNSSSLIFDKSVDEMFKDVPSSDDEDFKMLSDEHSKNSESSLPSPICLSDYCIPSIDNSFLNSDSKTSSKASEIKVTKKVSQRKKISSAVPIHDSESESSSLNVSDSKVPKKGKYSIKKQYQDDSDSDYEPTVQSPKKKKLPVRGQCNNKKVMHATKKLSPKRRKVAKGKAANYKASVDSATKSSEDEESNQECIKMLGKRKLKVVVSKLPADKITDSAVCRKNSKQPKIDPGKIVLLPHEQIIKNRIPRVVLPKLPM